MEVATPQEVEVRFKPESNKAVIDGKTAVQFQSLVNLILQRKVEKLSREWSKDPVILTSELLASLASAPQESRENDDHEIRVALGGGLMAGVALTTIGLAALETAQIFITRIHLLAVGLTIVGTVALIFVVIKARKRKKRDALVEMIERAASFLRSGK